MNKYSKPHFYAHRMAAQISDDKIEEDQNMETFYENYILIDVGANLTNKKFGRDLDSVIKRAKDSGKEVFQQILLHDV